MIRAFEILGIEPGLTIPQETLRDAFRESGRLAHPDAGGSEQAFAGLREAFAIVSSPSRRLRHWLELRGIEVETRGSVAPELMDLFTRVGGASQRAADLARRREQVKSALGLAMLEGETHACREQVEEALSMVEAAVARECGRFPGLESAATPDPATASAVFRNLAFLEKWRDTLRVAYARLV
jgi:hypothetical protein